MTSGQSLATSMFAEASNNDVIRSYQQVRRLVPLAEHFGRMSLLDLPARS